MPIKIQMPALSPTMTSGNLTKWNKKEGDEIKAGDVIAEIETDKATMEVEAVDEGTLAKIVVPAGTNEVPVNSLIAVLLEEDEDKSALDGFVEANSAAPEVKSEETAQNLPKPAEVPTSPAAPLDDGRKPKAQTPISNERVFASPLAKRIAEQENIDLSRIQGSGPNGRIIKSDLEGGSLSKPPRNTGIVSRNPEEYKMQPHSMMRKVIAQRLTESKQNIPHFYLNVECNLDKLMEARADINSMSDPSDPYKVSVNDMVIKAVSYALRDVPAANASWSDDGALLYNNIDVSVAVSIDDGLITPIVRNADQKSLVDISSEMKSLAKKAREGKLSPEEYQGGGFTISNLGMYNIKRFNAIINPPQSAILSVGAGDKRAVIIDNELAIATIMDVTLSCDHRIVDGSVGADFINAFRDYIEHPVKMLI